MLYWSTFCLFNRIRNRTND